VRVVVETIVGFALLYAAVVGVGYLVEARQTREHAEVARR